jgi:hypothetical protein
MPREVFDGQRRRHLAVVDEGFEARITPVDEPQQALSDTMLQSVVSNSPMQCMMKEVCAQCLQKHIDPVTGQETIVFSCFRQDQELDRVDFVNLSARLRQNTVREKLSNLWLDHLLMGNGSSALGIRGSVEGAQPVAKTRQPGPPPRGCQPVRVAEGHASPGILPDLEATVSRAMWFPNYRPIRYQPRTSPRAHPLA